MTNELAEKPMSYDELIDTLKGLVFGTFDRTTSKERKALGRAIDLLSNSDEDCISRQAVLALAKEECDTAIIPYRRFVKDINALPSVTPKPKTGHWIIKEGREQGYDIAGIKTWYIQIMCDKCGFIKTAIEGHTGQYHFCPNCGAKMESEDKE